MCLISESHNQLNRQRILANRKLARGFSRRIVLGFVWLVLPFSSMSAWGQEAKIFPQHPPKRLGIYATFVDLRFYASGPQASIVPGGGAQQLNYGERIERVDPGSAAWRAGLERGDIIVATYRPQWGGDARVPIRYRGHLRESIRRSGESMKLLVRNVRNGRLQEVWVRFRATDGPRPLLRSDASAS